MSYRGSQEVIKDKQPKEVENKALIPLNNSYTFDLSANKLYHKNIIVY